MKKYSYILNIILSLVIILLLGSKVAETIKAPQQESETEVVESSNYEFIDYSKSTKKKIAASTEVHPIPTTVVGTEVDGKINWIAIAHIGHIGRGNLIISSGKSHYSNIGIKKNMTLSVNIVSESMLVAADYVGLVSGAKVDKSKVFTPFYGSLKGAPMIQESPLTMECRVVDIYDTEHHDNFILEVVSTYADPSILDENDKVDYMKFKPILFEMPHRRYFKTGEYVGKAWGEGKNHPNYKQINR